jgi:hypothetical protein
VRYGAAFTFDFDAEVVWIGDLELHDGVGGNQL